MIGISTGLSAGTILKQSGLRTKQFVDTDCLTAVKSKGRFFFSRNSSNIALIISMNEQFTAQIKCALKCQLTFVRQCIGTC